MAPGLRYAKAGVILPDLSPAICSPRDLLPTGDPERSETLMATLDALNARFGRGTIRAGAVRPRTPWSTRANNRSPAYTTRFSDLVVAKS